jgi:hypothetical protein
MEAISGLRARVENEMRTLAPAKKEIEPKSRLSATTTV